MSIKPVYIINTSSFLPNEAVSNEEMETYLGYLNNAPSKSKGIVLRNNGIKRRYYALTKDRKITHNNAQLTAQAVKNLFKEQPEDLSNIELLSCGTSSPDQLIPSHAAMVHGWLPETRSIEVISSAGVCCAGMHALKYVFMAVKTGEVKLAVATGSERISASLSSSSYEEELHKLKELSNDPYIGFEKEFLRWMLSDGASAFLLSDTPNSAGISLRIDWMEGFSFANELEACMYMGAEKNKDGTLSSYFDYSSKELIDRSVLAIKQDVKLLSKNIVELGGTGLKKVLEKHRLSTEDIDYFLPHLSSAFFKDKVYDKLIENGTPIPYEKWFVNLPEVGNVGAASAYLMVDELFKSGKLKKGQRLLLLVPESGRFSYMYALMTVC
jgi:3-oxoacyl-[acyl-carrier-protein] synthase-3